MKFKKQNVVIIFLKKVETTINAYINKADRSSRINGIKLKIGLTGWDFTMWALAVLLRWRH